MIKSDNISDNKKHTTDPIYKSDNRNATAPSDARLENRKLRLAILGAGGIARKMAETVNQMEEVELYAVASRTEEKARQFADTYHASKWYGSYEEMVADDGIDLVYVATPHSHHKEHTTLCLNHNRAVLCEKAFAVNTKEAEDMIRLAKEKNILLAEAMWVRYMPMSFTLKEIIDSGVIGKITGLTANLGYSLMQVERLIRPGACRWRTLRSCTIYLKLCDLGAWRQRICDPHNDDSTRIRRRQNRIYQPDIPEWCDRRLVHNYGISNRPPRRDLRNKRLHRG